MTRVCILTGGGDAPGLNAVLRAFVKSAVARGIEVLGSEDGFTGLVEGRLVPLTPASVRGVLPRGGSILGCSNRAHPFRYPVVGADGAIAREDRTEAVLRHLRERAIDILVLVGGDGTQAIGKALLERGVAVVGIPKTIDNDLGATDATFGYETAVSTATWAIDALHSTAEAHDRVMLLEVMGRYAGWIAISAAIAGGADVVLVPEIPYEVERVIAKIEGRARAGSTFSIVVVGEGARPIGGERLEQHDAKGHAPRLGGAAHALAAVLEKRVASEVRVTVLGHLQRGGSPVAVDRLLGTRFGVAAADLCARGRTGRMVALRGTEIVDVAIEDACAAGRVLTPEHELVRVAGALGIETGVALADASANRAR